MPILKLSHCFATVFAEYPDADFDSFYEGVRDYFKVKDQFLSLEGNIFSDLQWPRSPGVYVVWKKFGESANDVLYIGMTGRVTTEGQLSDRQGLHHRMRRFHPYCFTTQGEYANHFEFGPNYGVNEIQKQLQSTRYSKREALSSLRVDCFTVSPKDKVAPAALESMFLQMYLEQLSQLPPANNSF